MYRKLVITGAAAAAIIGSGTAALAATGSSSSPTPSATTSGTQAPASSTPAKHPGRRAAARKFLIHAVHGQVVTKNKDGNFVTHDYARGLVKGVSTKLIVVHTADGTDQTFSVGTNTKVRLRSDGKGSPGKISDVHIGDTVLVAGTGAGTPAAGHVVDLGKK